MNSLNRMLTAVSLSLTLLCVAGYLHYRDCASIAADAWTASSNEAILRENLAILKQINNQQQLKADQLRLDNARKREQAGSSRGTKSTVVELERLKALAVIRQDKTLVESDKLHDPERDSAAEAARRRATATESNRKAYIHLATRNGWLASLAFIFSMSFGLAGALKRL